MMGVAEPDGRGKGWGRGAAQWQRGWRVWPPPPTQLLLRHSTHPPTLGLRVPSPAAPSILCTTHRCCCRPRPPPLHPPTPTTNPLSLTLRLRVLPRHRQVGHPHVLGQQAEHPGVEVLGVLQQEACGGGLWRRSGEMLKKGGRAESPGRATAGSLQGEQEEGHAVWTRARHTPGSSEEGEGRQGRQDGARRRRRRAGVGGRLFAADCHTLHP